MNNIDAKITAWQLGPVTILQAHPAPAPEKPAGIGDNRRES